MLKHITSVWNRDNRNTINLLIDRVNQFKSDLQNIVVGVDNTDFIEEINVGTTDTNLNDQFVLEGRLGTVTGNFIEGASHRATDFLTIGNAEYFFRYVLDGSGDGKFSDYQVVYYDSAQDYISGESVGTDYTVEQHNGLYGRKYEVPTGAAYVRFSIPVGNSQDGSSNLYTYLKVVGSRRRRFVNDYNSWLIDRLELDVTKPLEGTTVAFFGDSIIGNFRDGTGVPDIFKEQTGATVHNFGFGGTTMAIRVGSNPQAPYWDEFSMTRIADYIASGDFTPMDTAIANMNSPLNYFQSVIDELKITNFNDIDIMFIQHATNDFSQGIPAKDEQNLTNRETYYGAYLYAIEKILTAYPHIKIVLLTPSWRYWRDGTTYIDGADNHMISGQKLTDLLDVVYDMQSVYHMPIINNYHNLNWNKHTRNIYLQDGVHPNEEGRKVMGERVAHQAISIL